MPDYALSKIYKLTHPDTDEIYIGSTCQKYLSSRLQQHKRDFKRYKKGKDTFVTSFKILELGVDEVQIELIECYPCSCKEELHKKEGEYIKKNKCVNRCVAGRTKKEYREDNREKKKEYGKQWREKNKEKITKQVTCDCGAIVRRDNLSRHKKSKNHLLWYLMSERSDFLKKD